MDKVVELVGGGLLSTGPPRLVFLWSLFIFLFKVVEVAGEGSNFNGATASSFPLGPRIPNQGPARAIPRFGIFSKKNTFCFMITFLTTYQVSSLVGREPSIQWQKHYWHIHMWYRIDLIEAILRKQFQNPGKSPSRKSLRPPRNYY